jgi:hypothetical protein
MKAWRCACVLLLVVRKCFFSAGVRRGKRKSRPCMNGSRNGSGRGSRRSWPAAQSENGYRQLWGSAWVTPGQELASGGSIWSQDRLRCRRLCEVQLEENGSLAEWARLSEGCYVAMWRTGARKNSGVPTCNSPSPRPRFRIQKTDLQLRPIWHQKQERVEAHLLVCLLAFVLWKTLAQLCQRAGLGREPRKVFEELADISLVDVVLPTRSGDDPEALHPSSDRASGDPAATPESASAKLVRNGPSVVKTRAYPR